MTAGDKPVLLVADPEPYSRAVAEMILGLDYRVVHASTVQQAAQRAVEDRPAAIISEFYLGDGTFHELRAQLEKEPLTRGIPMLMLTNLNGLAERQVEGDCVSKHVMAHGLKQALQRSIRRFQPLPVSLTLSFLLERGRETIVQQYGTRHHIEWMGALAWEECLACADELAEKGPVGAALDECGTKLFGLLDGSCGLAGARAAAMKELGGLPLQMRFVGPADSLRIPFEALMNPEERKPLAVQHRFARSILRPKACRSADSRFVAKRADDGGEIRVLLIGLAESVEKDVHKVAQELRYVEELLAVLLRRGIRVAMKTITPAQATHGEIEQAMAAEWDMIHVAGHCPAPEENAQPCQECGIRFASGRGGEFHWLAPEFLEKAIRGKPPAFLFLNCCHGTAVYGEALVRSGVPGFLTFRGEHRSEDFVVFAREFYDALGEYGDVETATQIARSRVYESLPNSGIWAAASLVLQAL
jgi:CheY-like chemotaxis protein